MVVWYGGQFYSLFFLTQALKVDGTTANLLIAGALALATPFFIFFGWLSDKIGRKKIIIAGCLLAALTYFPLFKALTHYANPAIEEARESSPAIVHADPSTCSFQFDPAGVRKFTSSCDIATAALTKAGVPYTVQAAPAGLLARVEVGGQTVDSYEATGLSKDEAKAKAAELAPTLKATLTAAGYPEKADPARINIPMTLAILWVLVIYVTMVYGPIAAFLGRAVPDPDPLHLDVAAVPHRQRLVRRLPAGHLVRPGRRHRQHVRRPVVSDHDRGDDGGDRHAVPARNQGRGHREVKSSSLPVRRRRHSRRRPLRGPAFFVSGARAGTAAWRPACLAQRHPLGAVHRRRNTR